MSHRWCKQCRQYGHSKWLFLGTHRTHRLYISYRFGRVKGKIRNELRKMKDSP